MNDATRLFGTALGVAVIGSVAASMYRDRLAARLAEGVPAQVSAAARGSVGGALGAAQQLQHAGLVDRARHLVDAAMNAFLHGLAGGCRVAGVVSLAGAFIAACLLPSRPTNR